MTFRGFLLAAMFLFELTARAATITESFDSRADFASGTAVWNQALGKVHPTLQVTQYEAGTPPPIDFSVGDGSDGSFDSTTYANFSVGGDISSQTVRIDTDAHPILQFTSFTLDAGWKIIPVGTHPLIIKSLTTVKIYGEIHCEGVDGGASSGATPGAGGPGRCGGMTGGGGGAVGGAGLDGGDADPLVTGGRKGSFTGSSVGGGGGGSWYTAFSNPTNGPGSAGVNGQAGTSHSDPEFTTVAGGAGGGGGSGDGSDAGGGGGGGGGVVFIHAVGDIEIGPSGYILASGGKGGDASGNGGPGGGGGAGGTQLYSGGTVNNNNPDIQGSTKALSGAAGTNGSAAAGAIGGAGRNWAAYNTAYNGISVNPQEDLPLVPGSFVEFNTAANQYVVTKVFDTGRQFRSVDSVTFTPVSTHFLFEVAGSNDGFVLDDTGFVTDLTLVANKRYLKMRLTIQGGNPLAPDMIDTAAIDYTPVPSILQDDFTFKSAGCGRVDGGSPGNSLWLLLAPFLLLILRFKNRTPARPGR